MANPWEIGLELFKAVPTKVKMAAVPVTVGAMGIAYAVFGKGGGESSVNVSNAGNKNDQTPTPALLAKTRTPSATEVRPTIITQNGTRYSSATTGKTGQYPSGCSTSQFGRTMFMEEGGGRVRKPDGTYYTAWNCQQGKRVMNTAR